MRPRLPTRRQAPGPPSRQSKRLIPKTTCLLLKRCGFSISYILHVITVILAVCFHQDIISVIFDRAWRSQVGSESKAGPKVEEPESEEEEEEVEEEDPDVINEADGDIAAPQVALLLLPPFSFPLAAGSLVFAVLCSLRLPDLRCMLS